NIDHVGPLTSFRQSAFVHHQDRISAKLIEDINRTTNQRQTAVNLLGQLKYEKYGEYGTDPSPALSYALDKGITAIISLTRQEWMDDPEGDRAHTAAIHSIREVSVARSRPTCAHSYTDKPTNPTATDSPDYRLLKSRETRAAASWPSSTPTSSLTPTATTSSNRPLLNMVTTPTPPRMINSQSSYPQPRSAPATYRT